MSAQDALSPVIMSPEISERSQTLKDSRFQKVLDQCEGMVAKNLQQEQCPVAHAFLPGMYIRTIFMRAGLTITSAVHRTEHPFFIPTGDILVITEEEQLRLQGPWHGVTMPGTRRILQTLADTVWTTYHRTDKTNVNDIIADIIEPHHNSHLPEGYVPCHSR